jgi:hypothetical protein
MNIDMDLKELLKRLPEGWFVSDDERSKVLSDELIKELPPCHLLYEVPVNVVAHREGTDDILCHHIEAPQRFTVIHLSWIGKTEIDEKHPYVEVDGSFDDFHNYEAAFYGR